MAKKERLLNPDRPLTIEEAYALRPRLWWLYTLIVLVIAALLGWSGSAINYKGFASKGIEIAKGIGNGLVHPDTSLLFNLTPEGVPYQLLQTVAIAVLGTLIGGVLAIPFSFLACDRIVPRWVAVIFRAVILGIRTIPSLVWALVWIRVTGPNAFCGVVTESVCSIGMICKMEHTDSVTTPQKAFGPVTRIHTSAHTRLGMVRMPRMMARKMTATHLGTMRSQARKENGMASTPPISVPSTAMATVWRSW